MSAPQLYSGPGQVAYNFQGKPYILQAEGENGQVKLDYAEKRTQRASGMFGYMKSTLDDQTAKVTVTPFDSWAILPAVFPTYLGINTAGATTSGGLTVGVRPHDFAAASATGGAPVINGLAATTIWTPDGRLYTVTRSAITRHPSLKLGVGMPLFGGVEITGLVPAANAIGSASQLISILGDEGASETAQVNNAVATAIPPYGVPDYINEHWTGALGSLTGLTGLDAEDGWDIAVDAK